MYTVTYSVYGERSERVYERLDQAIYAAVNHIDANSALPLEISRDGEVVMDYDAIQQAYSEGEETGLLNP